jgi:hypothetical protein
MIYFIQNETAKAIKIGWSDDPAKRLVSLQTATPDRLALVATMDGGYEQERILHERYEDFRLTGEWFSSEDPNDSIVEFIAGLNIVKKALEPWGRSSPASLLFPELAYLMSAAVGHAATVYQCDRPPNAIYQVMRWNDGPGPGYEFWQWYSVVGPPWYASPESACVAYVARFKEWVITHRSNQLGQNGTSFEQENP